MKRYCKLIISTITIALIIMLSLSPASYAISKQSFSAWVGAALQALTITYNSTIAPYYNFLDDYLADPFSIVEQAPNTGFNFEYIPYTFEDTDDFYERSVLKIDKDVIKIDGVDYTDIWLSTDAAEKFRTNAFDIKTALNIANQSEGTFASGIGYAAGIPIYEVNGIKKSQNYAVPHGEIPQQEQQPQITYWEIGDINGGSRLQYWGNNIWLNNMGAALSPAIPQSFTRVGSTDTYTGYVRVGYDVNTGIYNLAGILGDGTVVRFGPQLPFDNTAFDFDWVAGNIPVDTALENEGLRIRVPTQDVNQWYQEYPETGPNITINMGDPELTNKIDDLIDLIIPLIPVLDIDFVEYESPTPAPEPEPIPEPEPYPDPDPQPGIVIPDLDWIDLFQTIKNIFNKIAENVSITTAIKNLLDKIKWFLDDFFGGLGELLRELPEFFERHVIDTIRRGLTGLKNIFLPILALLRDALGIWHYVVEWFQAISAPFAFYLGVLSSGYPAIMMPIYASIAGILVIAVYRRFGR